MPPVTPELRLPRIAFGGDFNPEQWPPEVLAEDLRLMREANVDLVTVGVFAWALVEPRPGAYDFAFFDGLLDALAEHGIGACLATMTASPPAWLARLHPETLPVREDGTVLRPGARQHFCPSSSAYRERAVALARRVAERYGEHPALRLWHVGNEYGCHVFTCHCDASAADFRSWLRERYGTLDALNDAWSTSFWSQRYGDWGEIGTPRSAPTFRNPAHQVDFRRFSDDALRECYRLERDVLRERTPDVPVTTNLYPDIDHVDPFRWAPEMDVVSFDSYPDPNDPTGPARAALHFDLMRSSGGGAPWMLMEQAPSAVSWRPTNAPKPPGVNRLWSFQAVAHGADAIMYFQWRQSRGGAEQWHSALVPHAGPQTRVHREGRELGRELAGLPGVVGTRTRAEVALLVDWPSWWALELDALPSRRVRVAERLDDHHRPLWRANLALDVLEPSAPLEAYRLAVVPCAYLLEQEHAARLDAWVRAGGHLVVSFLSGLADAAARVHLGGYPGPLRETLGVWVEEHWPLAAGQELALDSGGRPGTATLWSEWVHPEGAEVLATFASGELAGRPAVTRHARGAGVATYVACRPDEATMEALVRRAAADAGVEPVLPGLPEGVEATRRGDTLFVLNHGPRRAAFPRPDGEVLVGPDAGLREVELDPREVLVVRDQAG
jgi:beta-galactosidase